MKMSDALHVVRMWETKTVYWTMTLYSHIGYKSPLNSLLVWLSRRGVIECVAISLERSLFICFWIRPFKMGVFKTVKSAYYVGRKMKEIVGRYPYYKVGGECGTRNKELNQVQRGSLALISISHPTVLCLNLE